MPPSSPPQWQIEIEDALGAFETVAALAGRPIAPGGCTIEFHAAPHKPPSSLPKGKMAIYGFWHEGVWLKIGMAGAKSQARYTSQHYGQNAPSTLAKSLLADSTMASVAGFDVAAPGLWIKRECCRVNVLVDAEMGRELLALLEAFLHVRLKPRYER